MIDNRHTRRIFSSERARAAIAHRRIRFNALTLLALLALAVQFFVVQTHVHIVPAAAPGAAAAISLDGGQARAAIQSTGQSRDHYPIKDDPSNCPLCQEFAHSGHFVQSAQILLLLPASVSTTGIFLSEVLPSLSLLSHSWQGRAPPQR